ncbi:MAG: hypothetical protein ACYCSO_06490 [Cuniculiplasma sp.]
MRWRDLDSKVATRCIISFSGNHPLFDYSYKHNLYAPVIIRKISNSIHMDLLINGDISVSDSADLLLRKFGTKEGNEFSVIRVQLKSFDENGILEQINEIPSVIMGYLYLKNGKLFADFRFHRSKSIEVQGLLIKGIESGKEIAIKYLSAVSGEISFLSQMNILTPLSMIIYSAPSIGDDPLEKCLSIDGGIAQIEKKAGIKYRALIYLDSSPKEKDSLKAISEEEHIYEAEGNNPVFQEMRKLANDQVIFRASQFARVINGRMVISVFLPTYQVGELLKILAKIKVEMKENILLHLVRPFQPDLFEVI